MKNLFYKEMKLAMHPVIWVFIFLFPIMILIPNYPLFISFLYICSTYPILFLGANKGQQSNDIIYTCLLPIKKSDIIKARMLTVLFIQSVAIVLFLALSPLANFFRENINLQEIANGGDPLESVGFGPNAAISCVGFALVAFSIYDLIYFACFYRNGRSIVGPTLLGILAFSIICSTFTLVLPIVIEPYANFFTNNTLIQIAALAVGIIIYILMHMLIFNISKNLFEKVDL